MSAGTRTRKGALSRALSLMTLLVLTVAMTPMAAPSAVAATGPYTYWVDDDGSDGNPGTEALPFKTIKHAFDVAGDPDTVMVKPGTYDTTNGETFPLMAYGTELISTGGAAVTIIQGDGVNGIMECSWNLDGDRIAGFTFTGGSRAIPGGAIRIIHNAKAVGDPDTPLVEDNVFVGNHASDGGALLFAPAPGGTGFPLIRNNEFRGNTADSDGGAILVDSRMRATIEDNLFADNEADYGGALYLTSIDNTQTVMGNTFSGNAALAGYGGAIYMSPTGGQFHKIVGNVFSENEAATDGGALCLWGGNYEVFDNDASDNEAGDYGGFGYANHSIVESENNVIRGHTSGNAGAAWYVETAGLYLRNETIFNNTGLVAAVDALVTDTLNVDNSILWNPGSPADVVNADRLEYSCVFDDSLSGTGVIHDDPKFVNPAAHDARLAGDSPCIDTGDGTHSAPVDFFGTARPVDGDGVGGAGYDMGYFEYVPPSTQRLSDRTRYSTAVEIAEQGFPGWAGVTDVIIASGEDRAAADPLAASGLCWLYDAPLLLTNSKATPNEVKVAVRDIVGANGPVVLRVVGGLVSVPEARLTEIKTYVEGYYHASDLVTWTRVAATGGRYYLARKIADEMRTKAPSMGKTVHEHALVANGADPTKFFDALALSPIAVRNGTPVLLVSFSKVPPDTARALQDLGTTDIHVGGGPLTVSKAVYDELDADYDIERWYGQSRYDTAKVIADKAVQGGWLSRQTVGIAAKLPDALTGGSVVGRQGGVLLLTKGDTLTGTTKDWLVAHKNEVYDCYVFGGELSVKPAVVTAIANALK